MAGTVPLESFRTGIPEVASNLRGGQLSRKAESASEVRRELAGRLCPVS